MSRRGARKFKSTIRKVCRSEEIHASDSRTAGPKIKRRKWEKFKRKSWELLLLDTNFEGEGQSRRQSLGVWLTVVPVPEREKPRVGVVCLEYRWAFICAKPFGIWLYCILSHSLYWIHVLIIHRRKYCFPLSFNSLLFPWHLVHCQAKGRPSK